MDVKGEWVVRQTAVEIGVLTCFFMLLINPPRFLSKDLLAMKCVEVRFFF